MSGEAEFQAQPQLPPPVPASLTAVATTAASEAHALTPRSWAPNDEPLQTLGRAVGTHSQDLALLSVNQACQALPRPQDQPNSEWLGATLAALTGIAPRDETEGMLAVQIVIALSQAEGNRERRSPRLRAGL